jgi:heptosyltransferase-1
VTRFELSLPARPRILIVRLSAIGDVIHAVPILCALRRSLPHAVITWVAEGHAGDLIEGHPALDRLVRLPRKWLKSPRTVWGLRRQLRGLGCDVAIDIQGLTKSAVAAWLSGAEHRIGFGGVDGRELSPLLNNRLVTPTATHVIDRNLQLLEPLGIVNPAVSFDLPAKPVDTARMAAYLASAGLARGLAVINPGAGWPSKQWPAARFGAVAQHLAAAHRLPSVVVWAGAAEKQLAQEVVANSAGHAQAAPPTTLTELAALLRRARLLVASDTGPLHLAVAVGTPAVGLFGPMPHQRNGPYGPPHIAVQEMVLEGGSRARRRASNASMTAISVAKVCAACDAIAHANWRAQAV